MIIKKTKIEDLDIILELLEQNSLKNCNGDNPEKDWVNHFITDLNCFAFGLYENNILVSILLSEKLSYNGCILWYIATDINKQGQGYGSELLNHFEEYIKQIGINWIFLNSTNKSLQFYSKNNYTTSPFSKVYEHIKNL